MKLRTGTYLDTNVKTYRSWNAINYSSLSRFSESQDHCLMEVPAKSYFEFGSAFELLVEDRAKGTAKFAERFFECGAPGDMPDDLAGWIDRSEGLNEKYKWNKPDKKTGEIRLNKKHERLHEWLDSCQQFPGMMPMGKDQMEMLGKMVDNFMLMQPFADQGQEITLAEILPKCDFQIPIIWYVPRSFDGRKAGKPMRKKALLDVMFETDETVYIWDIKTAADIKRFEWMLKDKYWIQQIHYTVGIRSIFPGKKIVWQFLVSSKQAPYLSQPFCLDDRSVNDAVDVYKALCLNFAEWVDEGRPAKGWLPLETVQVYF